MKNFTVVIAFDILADDILLARDIVIGQIVAEMSRSRAGREGADAYNVRVVTIGQQAGEL